MASAVAGGALVALGLRRRSVGGAAAALAGGWLLYRGVGGSDRSDRDAGAAVETEPAVTERTVTVGKPADELYDRWRDPETMTRVFGEFAEVSAPSEESRRWVVTGPFGREVTWTTRFVESRPGELLRWESVEGATVFNEGSIRLRPAPADRGTEVTLRFRLDPPGGTLGRVVAERLDFVPELLAKKALYRFKSLAETGEIPTLEGNPSGRGKGDLL